MMFKRSSVACMAFSAILAGGCATAPEAEKPESAPAEKAAEAPAKPAPEKAAERFPADKEEQAKVMAEKLVAGLAESLKSGDFAAFRAAQPANSRQFTPEAFSQMYGALSKRYGKLASSKYLGKLDQGRVLDFLWTFTFERTDSSDKAAHHEIVCWVRTGIADNEPVIAGFSFYFF